MQNRGVAQLASALAWGARGRKFESSHPDKAKAWYLYRAFFYGAKQVHLHLPHKKKAAMSAANAGFCFESFWGYSGTLTKTSLGSRTKAHNRADIATVMAQIRKIMPLFSASFTNSPMPKLETNWGRTTDRLNSPM